MRDWLWSTQLVKWQTGFWKEYLIGEMLFCWSIKCWMKRHKIGFCMNEQLLYLSVDAASWCNKIYKKLQKSVDILSTTNNAHIDKSVDILSMTNAHTERKVSVLTAHPPIPPSLSHTHTHIHNHQSWMSVPLFFQFNLNQTVAAIIMNIHVHVCVFTHQNCTDFILRRTGWVFLFVFILRFNRTG